MSNPSSRLFGPGKSKPAAWLLIVGIVILASFVSMSVIWKSMNAMERIRLKDHDIFMEHMAQTAQLFLQERQLDYFYRIITRLTQISFIENLAVYQNGHRILQAGNGDLSRLDAAQPNAVSQSGRSLILQRRLMDNDPQDTELRAALSLTEVRGPKRAILSAFAVIAGLLLAVSLLSGNLYFIHRRLQENERIKARMIDSISHDASHDLTIIHIKLVQLLKRLKQPPKPEATEKDLKSALESTESMVRFLNNLKDQKRLGTGDIDIIPERLDVVPLMQTIGENFREKLSIRQMTFNFQPLDGPLTVWADPQIVKRVITNLIHNAIKYSRPETGIHASAERQNDKICFLIQDQGMGIEPSHWQRIFEPYWQVNPNNPGIGLGLYIARQFIRMSGGELGIRSSRPGEGTTFYFTLPVGQTEYKELPCRES
jgi:signal transduction histidine kinase